jgi:O-antigen/teichoic acid export membrane protein
MGGKILSKFLSSGVQALAIQVLGIFFFYFISLYFSKDNFGLISWANAISMFLTTLLSFGLEQVVIRRIAVSKTSDWAAAAFMLHAFLGSIIMLLIIFLLHFLFKTQTSLAYLPLFFTAQAIIFIASPLKQFLNAKEKFAPYGIIALLSNFAKIMAAIVLQRKGILSINSIIYVLIVSAVFEFAALLFYILNNRTFHFSFRSRLSAYRKLIKEASHQYIAVIFDSSLSRMDWILLGIMSTNAITADYSFAYRAFEIARLPIAIIAPVILPIFARMLTQNNKLDPGKKDTMKDIFAIEMFVAISLVILLNIIWVPVISSITHGKYGASNSIQFFVLSLCIPLHFFINFLWTLSFAGKKYRQVSTITIISAVSNVALNLMLIPMYGGKGAAIAFLLTCIIQATGYYKLVSKEIIIFPIRNLFILFLIGATVFYLSGIMCSIVLVRLIVALGLYVSASIVFRQINARQFASLRILFKK